MVRVVTSKRAASSAAAHFPGSTRAQLFDEGVEPVGAVHSTTVAGKSRHFGQKCRYYRGRKQRQPVSGNARPCRAMQGSVKQGQSAPRGVSSAKEFRMTNLTRRKQLLSLSAAAVVPVLAAACGGSTATEAPKAIDRTQRDELTWVVWSWMQQHVKRRMT